VASHDDLEEVLTAPLGELLHAHVVEDQEVGPEVVGDYGVVIAEGCRPRRTLWTTSRMER
jgi:hypothetical protein